MLIVDDLAKGVLKLADEVVERVTGGLIDPSEIIKGLLDSPVGDLIVLGVGLAAGSPGSAARLAEELAEVLER
ncbi:MAG: hypothetical protein JW797_12165 [Bradymonadales bacterium]|nr:hypothetical protein [Bradymonadales bacterium]